MFKWKGEICCLNKERKYTYAEFPKIYGNNKFPDQTVNKKEIHASFVDAPQIDKVMATVSDNCLIKVEMDLNL